MADGQVYVTVQADDSGSSTFGLARSVGGSGGATTLGGTITWSFNGGITAYYGWESPRKVNYVEGDVVATNDAVADAYKGATLADLLLIPKCVVFGS